MQGIFDYATDSSRASALFILPLSSESVVLDCGAGWGTLAFVLSRICSEVVALDSTFENLRFINIRKKQDGVFNLYPVLTDILDHPLREGSFDVVIMNGVLEWIGTADYGKPPAILQKQALKRVIDLLKKEGYFYLAIENRYGYRYFLGRTDEHSGMRFTSVLPRRVANLYSKLRRGIEYRTYTYSLGGYRCLLREAGFSDIEVFIALPDYRFPRFLIPADDPCAFTYVLEHHLKGHHKVSNFTYWPTKIAARLGLYKHFAPAFIIIARKGC